MLWLPSHGLHVAHPSAAALQWHIPWTCEGWPSSRTLKRKCVNSIRRISSRRLTYISSISAGVRRVTSGRMNQAIITASVPVPAKLWGGGLLVFCKTWTWARWQKTNKKPVLTPQCEIGALLIIKGVQKLNMIATKFEDARAQPAVFARKRCWGISAA